LTNDLAQARANYGKNTEKEWGKIILDTKNALDILEVEEGKYITTQAQAQTDANKESEAKRKARIAKELQDELDRQAKLEAIRKQNLDEVISAELSANDAARQSRLAMATTDEERIQIGYENKLAALKEAQIQEEIAVAGNEEALALIRQKYKDLEIVATAEVDAEELALNKKKADEAVKIADEQAKSIADINAKAVADQLANEAALADAKDKMVQATRDAITALGGLFKEGSDAAKAAALVDIAIGTGVGFINALDIAQCQHQISAHHYHQ
jgi:membrane protein involved in colicin uptake